MSMISELARELRRFAEDYEKEHVTLFGYRAKLLSDAADTIEALSAKVAEANMERSERYYGGGWIPVSERLPEKEAREYIKNELDGIGYLYPLLLTYRSPSTEKIHVVRFYWDTYSSCFVNNGEKDCEMERCLAWMPLPELYNPDREERP